MSKKISIIGSGNWGTVMANIISRNITKIPSLDPTVKMWVFPENIGNESLIDIINTRHENVKYLPGISLPPNLIATSDVTECTKNTDFLIFILPHQFLDKICSQMKPHLKKDAIAVSFIKGVFCSRHQIQLVSQRIEQKLQIPTCVFSGANVANEIARKKFAEGTLGFDPSKIKKAQVEVFQKLFSVPTLKVTPVEDVAGVEIAGALKNIVALAAGFVDGLEYGSNTKAAILRIGMLEIQKFGMQFFDRIQLSTFWQSSGFADLITTCYAGRNRKCAEEFARTGESWESIEQRLLNGQKLQGPSTCKEVYEFLEDKGRLEEYPLFHQIYKISFGVAGVKEKPSTIVSWFCNDCLPEIVQSKQ